MWGARETPESLPPPLPFSGHQTCPPALEPGLQAGRDLPTLLCCWKKGPEHSILSWWRAGGQRRCQLSPLDLAPSSESPLP